MGLGTNELRYLDLKNYLCRQIYEGAFQNGEKIPSERQLALDYEVSRITVRKALEILEAEDLVVREVGNGTRVTLRNYGNETSLDMIALVAPSKNPFFSRFIAEFQKCVWSHDALLLYVEAPANTSLEDCLYRLYSKNIRNAVVWPDDLPVNMEKLMRLRSIGMNLVFFDTDDALPYADSVFLDNEDAVRTLLQNQKKQHKNSLYISWDKREISNLRKREDAFRQMQPESQVLSIPWSRSRKISKEGLEQIKAQINQMEEGLILCGTGELGRQMEECLWQVKNEKAREAFSLAFIDDVEGFRYYPIARYNQNLEQISEKIYQRLKAQTTEGRSWKAKAWHVPGDYILDER